MSYEALLCFGTIALFLYDRCILLYGNEAVLLKEGGAWSVAFPSDQLRVRGRMVFLQNVFKPWQKIRKASWVARAELVAEEDISLEIERDTPCYYGIFAVFVQIQLFVALPVSLLVFGGGTSFLMVVALTYGFTAIVGIDILRRPSRMGLTRQAARLIVFECLACPPFAANVVQKISLAQPGDFDLIAAMWGVLGRDQFKNALLQIRKQVEEELVLINENTKDFELLTSFSKKLEHRVANEY